MDKERPFGEPQSSEEPHDAGPTSTSGAVTPPIRRKSPGGAGTISSGALIVR